MDKMQRRKFLAMGAAAAGSIAAIGTVYVATDRYEGWIRDVLSRSLPGYSFDPAGLARFTAEYDARQPFSIKRRVLAVAEGLIDTKPFLPERKAKHLAEREREVISDFLVGSDFFENYPNGPKVITYRGAPTACGSPFARFEAYG
jgi:hypothetical protein